MIIYISNKQWALALLQITSSSLNSLVFVDLVRIPRNSLWQVPRTISPQFFLLPCFSIKKIDCLPAPLSLYISGNQKTRSKSDKFWWNYRCFVFGKRGIFEKMAMLWQKFCRRELAFDYAPSERQAEYT